jgi:ketosteroid isomerase-like protein
MDKQASSIAQTFIDALKRLEKEHDVRPIVALFSDNATLERLTHKSYQGQRGAETFWREYLEPFEHISTEFTHITENDQCAVLEWESQGALSGNKEFSYKGASAFDFSKGKVTSFRTYYDSAAFVSESNL